MPQPPEVRTPPHALDTEEVLNHLGVNTRGLSSEQALRLLNDYGPNELRQAKPETTLQRLSR